MFYHNFKSENGQWLKTGNTQNPLNLKGKWKAWMWLWASSHRRPLATVKESVNAEKSLLLLPQCRSFIGF